MDKVELAAPFRALAAEGEEGKANRQAFAASLKLPLGESVAQDSVMRKVFFVDKLAPGAAASYPKENGKIDAVVVSGRGDVPVNIVGGEELFVPTFQIATRIHWSLASARDARCSAGQRRIQHAKNAIVLQENLNGVAAIRAGATPDTTVGGTYTSLTKELANDMLKEFERDADKGYFPDVLLVSAERMGDVRMWDSSDVDEVTRREIWGAAGLGSIWGVDIVKVPNLPSDEVYMIDTSRMGVMPERSDGIEILDDPMAISKLSVGFIAYEEVGFAVLDRLALRKAVIQVA
jgi:HK97 family phage major capsid protein